MVPQGRNQTPCLTALPQCWCLTVNTIELSPFPLCPLQVVAGKPRFLADPAAAKPSPQPQVWRLETDHLLSPQYTRRGTAIAERHSPTACGRTGPHLQVGISYPGEAVHGPHLAMKDVGNNRSEGPASFPGMVGHTVDPGILSCPHCRVLTRKLKAVEDRMKAEMEKLLPQSKQKVVGLCSRGAGRGPVLRTFQNRKN